MLYLSSVTAAEILKCLRIVRNYNGERDFLTFLGACEVILFDVEEADIAAAILAELTRTGQQIGPLDPFIAATAIECDRPLVTNNTKHYQRIIDLGFPLEIVNWREG